MTLATARQAGALALAALLASACGVTVSPAPVTPSPAPGATASLAPQATPSASPLPGPSTIALAVVANFTDLRVSIAGEDLEAALEAGKILIPCGFESLQMGEATVAVPEAERCRDPADVVAQVRAKGSRLGLLPVGLVSPVVKVLRIGGADLFGSPSRRAKPYPLVGWSSGLDPALGDYDRDEVRTVVSPLNWCPDRGVAQQTITMGKGWDWALDGGTARYVGTHIDTTFSGRDGRGWRVVDAVRVGDHGKVRALMQDADLTVADFRCPMLKDFHPAVGHSQVFSIDPRVASLIADAGVDVVGLASNHIYDHGRTGLQQTMKYLDKAGIPHTGAGMNLRQALEPVIVDVRGLRFGVVGFDGTTGSPRAGGSSPGTADLNTRNLRTAITSAKKGADVIIALPVWNWPEYWAHFTRASLKQRDAMFDLGVDAILGDGTHWAGALSLSEGPNGPQLAVASHGNFLFDQAWSRQTQEGVIYESTFYGSRLAQVRLHPYIILSHAQPNLTDPETDGAFVLKQVFGESFFELP